MLVRYSALLLCTMVGVFEVVAWGWDPLGVHRALNDGEELEYQFVSATINGLLPILCGLALLLRWRGLSSFLVPFMATFTWMQWSFWWFPYLLGDRAGMVEMVVEHKAQLQDLPRILPTINDHLVPDIEHTLLMPLSMTALFMIVLTYIENGTTGKGQRISFMLFSMLFSAVVGTSVLLSETPGRELGLMLVGASVLFTTFITLNATPKIAPCKEKAL